jgi:hypothetical protein
MSIKIWFNILSIFQRNKLFLYEKEEGINYFIFEKERHIKMSGS